MTCAVITSDSVSAVGIRATVVFTWVSTLINICIQKCSYDSNGTDIGKQMLITLSEISKHAKIIYFLRVDNSVEPYLNS